MTGKQHHSEEYPDYDLTDSDSYTNYIESTPLEARFDPNTIQLMVIEAIPAHKAYTMTFGEYLENRSRFSEYDEAERKRLSFYLPLFPAMRSQDFAYGFKISFHKFLVTIAELGLITFLYDFHEECSVSKIAKHSMAASIKSGYTKVLYMQIDKQKIGLSSASGVKQGAARHFTPSVPEWLYNAITDTAAYLNMTTSDLVYLCWCIGVQKTLPNDMVDIMLDQDLDAILQGFGYELDIYVKRINGLLYEMEQYTIPTISK